LAEVTHANCGVDENVDVGFVEAVLATLGETHLEHLEGFTVFLVLVEEVCVHKLSGRILEGSVILLNEIVIGAVEFLCAIVQFLLSGNLDEGE
jgi:hypothetical protein